VWGRCEFAAVASMLPASCPFRSEQLRGVAYECLQRLPGTEAGHVLHVLYFSSPCHDDLGAVLHNLPSVAVTAHLS
jgi:hypothetical protein